MIHKTGAFLEKFSLNRLKLGELTKHMSDSELQESKQKLFSVLDTVAVSMFMFKNRLNMNTVLSHFIQLVIFAYSQLHQLIHVDQLVRSFA